jgi:hypothetical protein
MTIPAWVKEWAAIAFAVLMAVVTFGLYARRKGVESMQTKVTQAEDKAAVATATNQQLESRHETNVAVERLPDAAPGVALGDAPANTAAGKLSDWAD